MCSILTSGERGVVRRRGERKFHSNQLLRSWNRGNGGEGRSVRNFFFRRDDSGHHSSSLTCSTWERERRRSREISALPLDPTPDYNRGILPSMLERVLRHFCEATGNPKIPLYVERPFDLSLSSFNKFEKGSFFPGKVLPSLSLDRTAYWLTKPYPSVTPSFFKMKDIMFPQYVCLNEKSISKFLTRISELEGCSCSVGERGRRNIGENGCGEPKTIFQSPSSFADRRFRRGKDGET